MFLGVLSLCMREPLTFLAFHKPCCHTPRNLSMSWWMSARHQPKRGMVLGDITTPNMVISPNGNVFGIEIYITQKST